MVQGQGEGERPLLLSDVSQAIRHPLVDLVWILTPPHLHFPLAKEALLAGKNLFMEKPGSLTTRQADELLLLARERGLLIGVDFVMRHNPIYKFLAKASRSGIFGPLQRFSLENHARDDHLPPEHWFWDVGRSGGIWVEHGVHFFDLACWLAGTPVSVAAIAIPRPLLPPVLDSASGMDAGDGKDGAGADLMTGAYPAHVIDSVSAVALFSQADGSPVQVGFHHSFTKPKILERTWLSLVFERAILRVDGWIAEAITGEVLAGREAQNFLASFPWLSVSTIEDFDGDSGGERVFHGRGRTIEATALLSLKGRLGDRQNVYMDSIREGLRSLVQALNGGGPVATPFALAREALGLAEAAASSHESGRVIMVDEL